MRKNYVKALSLSRTNFNFFSEVFRSFRTHLLPSIIFWCCAASPNYGNQLPPFADWGPNTASLAGNSAAMVSNHDAMLTNPAGLIYLKGSNSLGGGWGRLPEKTSAWSVSLADASSDIMMGFHYSWADMNEINRQMYTISAVYGTSYGALGVSAHAIKLQNVDEGRGWHFTNSLGIFAPLGNSLALGIYSRSPYDFEKDRILPPSIHMGLLLQIPKTLRAHFESGRQFGIPNQDWYYSTACDLLFQEYFSVRGGYRWDHESGRSLWSVGGAILAPKIEIIGYFLETADARASSGFGFEALVKF